jgi:nitrogen-specific signal transduction histidine kinase
MTWQDLGDNSGVQDYAKLQVPKELLHEVNNQLEIAVGAAELLSQQYSDPSTKERCAQIQSAVLRTSKLLKTYFNGATSIQPAPTTVSEANIPVGADRV